MIKKYRYILLPFVSGLIIVLVTTIFVLPKIKLLVDTRTDLRNKKEKLSRLTEKATLLEGFDEYELKKKVVVAEKALPSKKAIAEILATLSSLSSQSGVSFVGINISPGKLIPEKSGKLVFQASFKGSKEDLKAFLRKLDEVLPVMGVVSLGVKGETLSLKIESYFSPPPESLGKIDVPLSKISQLEEDTYRKIAQFKDFEEKLPSVPIGKENPFSTF